MFVLNPIGEIEPFVKEGFLVQATKVNQKMIMRRMFLLKVGFAFYFCKDKMMRPCGFAFYFAKM